MPNVVNIGYINQIITTIQGEGNTVGYPIILVRFDGCNLKCPMCDTKHTWTPSKKNRYTYEEIKEKIDEQIKQYPNILNLLITGGEPFYQPELLKFLINEYSLRYNIEIETNGYIILDFNYWDILKNNFIQLNISPKLELEAYPFRKITNEDILKTFYKLHKKIKENHINYIFKLVYCKEWEDRILNFYNFIDTTNIERIIFWMMPLTPPYNTSNFAEKYRKNCLDTVTFCKKYGFKYSPRIHVDLFKDDICEKSNLT